MVKQMGSILYCRLCGVPKNNLIDVFKENDRVADIKFKIRTKLYIVISESDKFPHTVCIDCVDKLQEFCSFTKICQLNQIRLFEANSHDSKKDEIDTTMCFSECEEILVDDDVDSNIYLLPPQKNCSNPKPKKISKKLKKLINNANSEAENFEEKCDNTYVGLLNNKTNNVDTSTNQTTTNTKTNSLNNNPDHKIPLSKIMKIFGAIRVKSETEKIAEIERICQQQSKENRSYDRKIRFSELNLFSYLLKRTNFLCEREYNKLKPKLFDLAILDNVGDIVEQNNSNKHEKSEFKKNQEDSETRLNQKYKRKIPPNANYVKCIFCGEIFLKTEFAEEHMHLHTNDPELHKLILEHMSTQATKIFQCDECDAVFNRQLAIIEHKNEQHNKIKPVKCHLCDRKFPGLMRTRSHVRSSHLVKSFKCDMCPYAAKTVPDLDKHKRGVHTDEKIMCNICGKLFSAFRHNLKKHLETHSDTLSHKCDLCDMAYKTRSSLAKHRENIHFPVSMMCSLCGTISASKFKYKKHFYMCRRKNKTIIC